LTAVDLDFGISAASAIPNRKACRRSGRTHWLPLPNLASGGMILKSVAGMNRRRIQSNLGAARNFNVTFKQAPGVYIQFPDNRLL
jgi:hypothetical protein